MKEYKGLFVPSPHETEYRKLSGNREYVMRVIGGKKYKLVQSDDEFTVQQLESMGYDELKRDSSGRLWARKSSWKY